MRFKSIRKTERNVIKVLDNDFVTSKLQSLVDMYRSVSSVLYKTEELKDRIYPDIKKEFDEVFDEQDKLVTRVIQIGELIASISKDSTRSNTNIDVDAMVADIKAALPELSELVDQVYSTTMEVTRVQMQPSLYVLNKNSSDPERVKLFTESKLAEFIATPDLALLNDAYKEHSIVHSMFCENREAIVDKLRPFMSKVHSVISRISKHADTIVSDLISKYDTEQSEVLIEDDTDANPHVIQIKRLKAKATAQLVEDSEYTEQLVEAFNSYEDIGEIISKASDLKKQISNDLKEEMTELFEVEERTYNSVIDLGENIVAFTSNESSRGAGDAAVAKKFIELLTEAIPAYTDIIEDIYKSHLSTTQYVAKSSIKVKKETLRESIDALYDMYKKIHRFVKGIAMLLMPKLKKADEIKSEIASLVTMQVQETIEEDTQEPAQELDHYCIYQKGVAIFGVGSTEEEALKNAEQWIDTNIPTVAAGRCGKDVVDYFNINGTPDEFVVQHGIVSLK